MAPLADPPARVAIVHPYWELWEHTAGPTFRSERLALAHRVASILGDRAAVVGVHDFASPEEAAAVADALGGAAVDVLLVLQTMATPPGFALALLERMPEIPIVLWALHETGLAGSTVSHRDITTQGATVGAPMLTNLLSRSGIAVELVLGRLADPVVHERVGRAIRIAATARRLRRARLGRIGRPIDGYLHVDVEAGALREAIGIDLIPIDPEEVVDAYRAIPDDEVAALEDEVCREWLFEEDVTVDEALGRSLRAALAIEKVAHAHRLDAGAFNCHTQQFRFGEPIGIAPCFGLGRLTSLGMPWTCTGDVVTAVAMLTTKRLGGVAVYHEIETVDYASGEVVIANSGEHDLAWLAPGERPRLRRNGWFCDKDPHCGVCAVFEPAPGPATLVAFTPHPAARGGFRYIVARGELTARRFPTTGTVNGAFRFAAGPVEETWVRWVAAGAIHHSSATPGDIADEVVALARHLGIEAVVV
jgi:L-arabinose isomerase